MTSRGRASGVALRQAGGVTRPRRPRPSRRPAVCATSSTTRGSGSRTTTTCCALLLAELDYARHPHAHEGVAPRYGALLVVAGVLRRQHRRDARASSTSATSRSTSPAGSPTAARRSSPASPGAPTAWSASTAPASTSRRPSTSRWARARSLCSASGGAGSACARRRASPPGTACTGRRSRCRIDLAERVAADAGRRADPDVLANLLELCTHWLAAGRVGATLVWRLDGDPAELGAPRHGAGRRDPRARPDEPRRTSLPLLNAPGAVRPGGARRPRRSHRATVGVHLRSSEASRRELAPFRGTRHTVGAAVLRRGADGGRLRRVVERCRCRSSGRAAASTPTDRAGSGAAGRRRGSGVVTCVDGRRRMRVTPDGGDQAADPGDDERRPVRPGDVRSSPAPNAADAAPIWWPANTQPYTSGPRSSRTGRCTGRPSAARWPPSPGRRRP